MKKLIFIALLLPTLAFAGGGLIAKPFDNYTGFLDTARQSAAINVSSYKTKTLYIQGKYSGAAFLNLSGTTLARCGPASTGPWTTAIANDYAQTAVSVTTNSIITWTDACVWLQLQFTRAKRAVNVWVSGSN